MPFALVKFAVVALNLARTEGSSVQPLTPPSPARWPTASRPDSVHLVPSTSRPTRLDTAGIILDIDRLNASYWAGMLPRNLSVVNGAFHFPTHTPASFPTVALRGSTMKPTSAKRLVSMRRCPLQAIPLASWGRFVSVMVVAPRDKVTPRYRLGTFGMDTRRLADVGFMVEPRKATVGNEAGVWVGKWKAPLTTDKFLGSMPAQYEAFKRSMSKMIPAVSSLVGREVDGTRCTLSGLLAVGHLAGEGGVKGWTEDPSVRARFKATTANFTKANGIF